MGAFNGSGTFVRTYDWTTDEGNGINIEASRMDTEDDGFATGLSNCITKDGQTTISGNIPFNSKKITGLANGSTRTDSVALGQVQDGTYQNLGTTGGSADAYTASPSPAITTYTGFDGLYLIKISADNTGASTLDISAVGAKNIKKFDGAGAKVDVEAGDLQQDQYYLISYDGTDIIVYNPEKPYLDSTNFVNNNFVPNMVVNGQGLLASNGTSYDSTTFPANDDDTILLDNMRLLSDGDDIVDVSQDTSTVPTGAYSSIKFDQETANKQWAYVQHFNTNDSAAIIGGTASLSFSARKGGSNATLETLRAAIISWDGTADAQTTDVVATWNGAGTDPSLATNWTYENTPSDLTLTTSFQDFKVQNVSIDTASTSNVALFIWLDDTDATVADTAFITNIKLENNTVATQFNPRPELEERVFANRTGKEFISSVTASSSATVEFTNLTSAYTKYIVEFIYILPANNGAGLIAQFSTDNGSTYANSSYLSRNSAGSTTDAEVSNANNTTRMSLTRFDADSNTGQSNQTAAGLNGHFEIFNPSDTAKHKQARWNTEWVNNSAFSYQWSARGSGRYNGSTSAVNAVRFKMSTSNADTDNGNIASGIFNLYGVR